MQIPENIIEFLRLPKIQDIIDIGDFEKLYDVMQETPSIKNSSAISTITQLLHKSNINPLDRMVAIPPYYLCYSDMHVFTIPDHIQAIRERAFHHCPKLTDIDISEGVEIIIEEAFSLCDQLRTISLPKSLGFIGAGAFYLCKNLKHIYYNGTSENWNHITISGDAFSGVGKVTLHCKDGDFYV